MTNKQERYFVVSESELEALRTAYEYNGPGVSHLREEAEDACRARPVPEWATDFARRVPSDDWEQCSDPQHVFQLKEIEK